jgi:hypothetical protein
MTTCHDRSHGEGRDPDGVPEQQADRNGDDQRKGRPHGRAPAEPGIGVAPPERQIQQRANRERPRRGASTGASERRRQAHDGRRRDDRREEEDRKVEREHDCVAPAADQTGHARADAERGGRAEHQSAKQTDTQTRADRQPQRSARLPCRSQHESINARVEISQGAQPLAQFVDPVVTHRVNCQCSPTPVPVPAPVSVRPRPMADTGNWQLAAGN